MDAERADAVAAGPLSTSRVSVPVKLTVEKETVRLMKASGET
jgi:hypothetical protein